MPRTFHWKWVGLLAVTFTPGLAAAQTAAPQAHTVRQGDTLWDLAKQYRSDPFLWPDLYRLNTSVVEDPHWIYPGEVLRLSGADTVLSVPTVDTPAPSEVAVVPASAKASMDVPADTAPDAPVADTAVTSAATEVAQGPPQATLAQLTRVSANEPANEEQGLFGPKRSSLIEQSLLRYTHQPYRPLRQSEFYSSGFLTDNQKLPFGDVLGPIIPQQIRSSNSSATAMPYSSIAVEAPRGATYQIGDTLLVVELGAELQSHGEVVRPTGLVRVVDTVQGRYVASVMATYGLIRKGQRVLPAEKFTPSSEARAVPVTEGVRATFIGGTERQDMKAPQMVVFLDKGRRDGVAPGDLFEIRRTAARLPDGRQLTNDVMATMQIVYVRDHSATGRLLNVLSPDIAPGTGARQVAKLPS